MATAGSGEAPHLPEELLWVPERCDARSAWLGHIPFGFWLVGALGPRVLVELGTHWGHSYFAFCQAIRDLGLPTKAFAVDTWAGDEHSGYYGDDVFVDVDNWNEQRFATFSTLLRSTFDAAAEGFDVSSIDLLHIDGLHTYDAVKHDFENWLPKMSPRGIVLLHDIAETRDDFGVHVLWSELVERYPTVGFEHSHGLGVVCVGDEMPDAILALLPAQWTDHAMPRVFQALGERLELMARSESQAGLIDDLQVENEHRLRIIEDLQVESEHRLRIIEDFQVESEHRLRIIEDLQVESEHRLRIIEDLKVESEHRLRTIEELLEIRTLLDTEIEHLRSTLARTQETVDVEHSTRMQLEETIRSSPIASFALRRRLP